MSATNIARSLIFDDNLISESLEYLDSGIAVFDSGLRLVRANRRYLELRDLPPNLGEPGTRFEDQIRFRAERGDYGSADPDEIVRDRVAQARRFEPHCVERNLSDGRFVEIRGNPLPDGGFISIYTDITERKRSEIALREREQNLQRTVDELELAKLQFEEQGSRMAELAETLAQEKERAMAADRAKSEFLATASHELRTPLTTIIGFSHLARSQLARSAKSEPVQEHVGHILDSAEHLLDLINDVLDVSKIQSGKDELFDEALEVAAIVASVLRLVRQRAEDSGVAISDHLAPGLPQLLADETKIKQILVNLLTNAIKFTPEGGKVSLEIRCEPSAGYVFQVSDTGIGMAPEQIPKALAVFGQIDSGQGRKHHGSGLGLPLSKSLAEIHGGSLDVQSQEGVGTTVTLRLPAERIVTSD